MIKITQGQAHLILNSPVAQALFNGDKKEFPIKDALLIADFIEQIRSRQQPYLDAMRKIVRKHGGTAHENGAVSYEDPESRDNANAEMAEINRAEIELNGESIGIGEDWPKLTLAEVTLLKPFLRG